MTVLVETLAERFPGNGSATEFDFDFRIFDEEDVVAHLINDATGDATLLTEGADYEVDFDDEGGTVTTAVAVPSGYTLDLRPVFEITQPASIKNQGTFRPEVHERVMDRLAAQQQYLHRLVRASVRAPDYETALDLILPPKAARIAAYLAFDANGQPVASAGTGADAGLREDLAAGNANLVASAAIAYEQTAAEISAGVTPVNYAYPPGDVRRYGAVLDGTTDDTAALIAATQATAGTGVPVVIPYGTMRVTPGTAQTGAASYNCACRML